MECYCLFCLVNKTASVRRYLQANWDGRVIQPRIVQRKWIKGVDTIDEHDYMPGYLFLYSQEKQSDVSRLSAIDGAVRVLGYEDRFELLGSDYDFAMGLLACDGKIGNIPVYQVGDRLELATGLFSGHTGRILKVDHHRKRLQITFDFDNREMTVWVGYEVV